MSAKTKASRAALCSTLLLAMHAHAQVITPTSHLGTVDLEVGLGNQGGGGGGVYNPVEQSFADWHAAASFTFTSATSTQPGCNDAAGSVAADTIRTPHSLHTTISGNAGRTTGPCAVRAQNQVSDQWSFSLNQPTCFKLTVTMDLQMGTPFNGASSGSFLLTPGGIFPGTIQLTMGTLSSGQISGGFSGETHETRTYAGTLSAGTYNTQVQQLVFVTNTGPYAAAFASTFSLEVGTIDCICTADFNNDGDFGTDADIQDFFSCLGGDCCPTCGTNDFNGDGDSGTDLDIQSFFSVLGGSGCLY